VEERRLLAPHIPVRLHKRQLMLGLQGQHVIHHGPIVDQVCTRVHIILCYSLFHIMSGAFPTRELSRSLPWSTEQYGVQYHTMYRFTASIARGAAVLLSQHSLQGLVRRRVYATLEMRGFAIFLAPSRKYLLYLLAMFVGS
jgi:hypothetical protein